MTPLQAYHEAVRDESSLISEISRLKDAHNEVLLGELEIELGNASNRILANYTDLADWLHERAGDA